jgi:hypothetical protein
MDTCILNLLTHSIILDSSRMFVFSWDKTREKKKSSSVGSWRTHPPWHSDIFGEFSHSVILGDHRYMSSCSQRHEGESYSMLHIGHSRTWFVFTRHFELKSVITPFRIPISYLFVSRTHHFNLHTHKSLSLTYNVHLTLNDLRKT